MGPYSLLFDVTPVGLSSRFHTNGRAVLTRSSRLRLVDDLPGDAETVNGDGKAAIDGDLGEHGADFVGSEPVVEGTAAVGRAFVHFPQRGEYAEREDRALTQGERGIAPDLAPAVLGG